MANGELGTLKKSFRGKFQNQPPSQINILDTNLDFDNLFI